MHLNISILMFTSSGCGFFSHLKIPLKFLQDVDLFEEKDSVRAKCVLLAGLLTLKKFIVTLFSLVESTAGSMSALKVLPFLTKLLLPLELLLPCRGRLVGVGAVSFS